MTQYYQTSEENTLRELKTSEKGLSNEEVGIRQEKYGENMLQEGKQVSIALVFLSQFKDLLVVILIIAALFSMISGHVESTIVILFVLVLNAIIGTIQTVKAQKSLASLKSLSTPKARVIRDGVQEEISSNQLTVGDILLLEAGDVVSADARIIKSHSLQVNESALTGEAVSIDKKSEPILRDNCPLGDQVDMVFSSGLVTYGRGVAVVTNIGMETEIGKIATLMKEAKERKTPLQKDLDMFSKRLSILIIGICIVLLGLNMLQGVPMLDAMMFAVALAVAAIPEALASIVTITLAMGTQKMAKEDAIIKEINSVETLGAVSVICSDKTGTLTQNKMEVQKIFIRNECISSSQLNQNNSLDNNLLLACGLCCDAIVEDQKRIGDPTELALVDLLEQYQLDEEELRLKYPRISELPFDSERKLMSTVGNVDGKLMMFVKGAPDELLQRCQMIETSDGEIRNITNDDRVKISEINESFANQGLRVLAFAYKIQENQTLTLADESDLVFIGLISLMDPPREESKQAVLDCKRAGIKPIMITGDHKVTARSIAKQIGIFETDDMVMDGNELDALSKEELQEKLPHISVYARVAPAHKIRIVQAWQALGNVVAMTGDGVNDAPALKSADVGVAMGITGTDVSKDASSMILMDDNFATIIKAVVNGRNIYENIKNSIMYLLSGNFAAIMVVLYAAILLLPVPLFSVHLLFINLVTDSLPAIAIGLEKPVDDLLDKKPRKPDTFILDSSSLKRIGWGGLLIAIFTLIAYYIGLSNSHALAATMAFAVLCLSRLFHGFNNRGTKSIFKIGLFTNKYSIWAFIIGFVLLNSILLLPVFHSLFMVVPITGNQLGLIYLLGFMPTFIIQLIRVIISKTAKSK